MAIPFIGKIIESVVDKGADLISEFIPDKDLAKRLDHEFRTQMSRESHSMQQLELSAEQAMFEAQQKTIQAELHQSDLYTKRTRPKIARQSWYVTAAYALISLVIPVLPTAWGLNAPSLQWNIFLVLASPALTYMGVREFGKWKNGAKA